MSAKIRSCLGVSAAGAAAITRDEIIFIVSLIVMIVNAIIAYLEKRSEKDKDDEDS